MSDRQACAHQRVTYRTELVDGGPYLRGWWQCDSCRMRFLPEAVVEQERADRLKLEEDNAALCNRIKEMEHRADEAAQTVLGLRARTRLLEQGCAEFRCGLYDWSQAYPTDIFPEPPYGEHGRTVGDCSAAMGRHVTKRLLEDFDRLVPLDPAPK